MINRWWIIAAMVCCSAVAISQTAESPGAPENSAPSSSSEAMPQVQEAKEGEDQGGMMSGDKPFLLSVDENVGELVYVFDDVTKELESIQAKRGVIFASEDMTLNSDDFEYKTLNSQLVAGGKKVVVRLGEMIITCQLFKYNPETQEGEFTGTPLLYNRDKEGKVTTTGGKIISVVSVNGKFQMRVGSGGGARTFIRSSGAADAAKPKEGAKVPPGTKGAIMTYDDKTGLNSTGNVISERTGTGRAGSDRSDNSSGRSLLPMPDLGGGGSGSGSGNSGASRIDPNKAEDVQALTNQKPE